MSVKEAQILASKAAQLSKAAQIQRLHLTHLTAEEKRVRGESDSWRDVFRQRISQVTRDTHQLCSSQLPRGGTTTSLPRYGGGREIALLVRRLGTLRVIQEQLTVNEERRASIHTEVAAANNQLLITERKVEVVDTRLGVLQKRARSLEEAALHEELTQVTAGARALGGLDDKAGPTLFLTRCRLGLGEHRVDETTSLTPNLLSADTQCYSAPRYSAPPARENCHTLTPPVSASYRLEPKVEGDSDSLSVTCTLPKLGIVGVRVSGQKGEGIAVDVKVANAQLIPKVLREKQLLMERVSSVGEEVSELRVTVANVEDTSAAVGVGSIRRRRQESVDEFSIA